MTQQEYKGFHSLLQLGVWSFMLDNINISDLITSCYKTKKNNPSVFKTNHQGGYQSSEEAVLKDSSYYSLIVRLNNLVQKFFKNPIFNIEEMWVNISPKGSYNSIHTHSYNISELDSVSGVLYLQVPPNCGNFIAYNPLSLGLQLNYTPKPGQLLLFSKHLPHSVEPNQSDEDRISIAFNFKQ